MKTLIILHGWQSSKEKWQRVKELLEEQGIEVIIPDIPGFKPETELTRAWTLDDYVEWFKDFSQDRDRFFLLGHSFGGRIGIKFAAQYPDKLDGLFLVSAAGIKRENFSKKFWQNLSKIGKYFPPVFKKIFYRYILRKTDYFKASGFLKQTIKNILNQDLTHLFAQIRVPVDIIWGDKDKITPLADACLIKEQIKFSQLEILPGIGHAPHLGNPELLAEKIIQFLKRQQPDHCQFDSGRVAVDLL